MPGILPLPSVCAMSRPAIRSATRTSRFCWKRWTFPEPVISVAIEPKTKADQEKMGVALSKLGQEDPTFQIHTDPDTNQTIISGMGELHLEIIVDRMMREFNVGRECRQAAGGVQGNNPQEGRSRRQVHPADRRPRPIRSCGIDGRAQRSRRRIRFRQRDQGRRGSEGIHQADRAGH